MHAVLTFDDVDVSVRSGEALLAALLATCLISAWPWSLFRISELSGRLAEADAP